MQRNSININTLSIAGLASSGRFSISGAVPSVDATVELKDVVLTDDLIIPIAILKQNLIQDMKDHPESVSQSEKDTLFTADLLDISKISDINLFSLGQFNGRVNVKGSNVKYSGYQLDNLDFVINFGENVFFIKDGKFSAFDGDCSFNANLDMSAAMPSITTSFSINNIRGSGLAKFIYNNPQKFDGFFNVNGTFSSHGLTSQELLSMIDGDVMFAGRKVVWDGFNIGQIINFADSNAELEDKIKSLQYYKKYGKSEFDSCKGAIKFVTLSPADINIDFSSSRANGQLSAKYSAQHNTVNSIAKISFYSLLPAQQMLKLGITSKGVLGQEDTDIDDSTILKYAISKAGKTDADVDQILRNRS